MFTASDDNPSAPQRVSLSSVEAWARGRLAVDGLVAPLRQTLLALVDQLESARNESAEYFLSVVIRTQAKRWEQLQDSLLCLAGQTDQSFELLIMLHDVPEERVDELRALVEAYPADFARRVRLIPVAGGGRARPLAEAVPLARGSYLSFYDDDDLLMGNWVEAFRSGAEQAPGQLIRANVATQRNRAEVWESGAEGQRTIGVARAEYAKSFSLIDHLQRNHSPFMGIAFPRAFFTLWGESFDEELPVCEDWDVLLRAAGLVGVHSISELTAIYRFWEGSQTSYTSHQVAEWREAEARVQEKMERTPFFAPEGSVADALAVLSREQKVEKELGSALNQMMRSSSWRVTAPVRRAIRKIRAIRGRS